jgi:hypothetical protein
MKGLLVFPIGATAKRQFADYGGTPVVEKYPYTSVSAELNIVVRFKKNITNSYSTCKGSTFEIGFINEEIEWE